jgi:hypothetical protein
MYLRWTFHVPRGTVPMTARGQKAAYLRSPDSSRPRDRRRGRQDRHPRRRPLPAAGPPPRQGKGMRRGRQHPAEGLPQAAVHPRYAVPGSRPGLLRAPARHPTPRSPTTSASSAPSASKSPSAASPNPSQAGQQTPRPPWVPKPQPGSADAPPGCCRAPGRGSIFGLGLAQFVCEECEAGAP